MGVWEYGSMGVWELDNSLSKLMINKKTRYFLKDNFVFPNKKNSYSHTPILPYFPQLSLRIFSKTFSDVVRPELSSGFSV